jgi:two-component system LytT family response regulator
MHPIRTLVVDDEALARENLRLRLRLTTDFTVIGECATGREALQAIAELKPELVFLDIRMPDLDGFAVLERLEARDTPAIVFVTAFDRYAVEAFRVHALDYLLKPFEEERFAETLQACRQRVTEMRQLAGSHGLEAAAGERGEERGEKRGEGHREERGERRDGERGEALGETLYQVSEGPAVPAATGTGRSEEAPADPFRERLVIKSGGRVFFLRIANVDWIEAYGDYVRLHVGGQSYLLRRTMNEMEARLPGRDFARISRSAIVNLDRVKDLEPATRGELLVRLSTGPELKLTRTYREKLEGLLGDRL